MGRKCEAAGALRILGRVGLPCLLRLVYPFVRAGRRGVRVVLCQAWRCFQRFLDANDWMNMLNSCMNFLLVCWASYPDSAMVKRKTMRAMLRLRRLALIRLRRSEAALWFAIHDAAP